ncbi:MAG TPA: sigma-54-dependent Fis family transcriptional regulator [Prosthecochloris aestuarii]|uniref:Sigma-54-dependent Fis family transcriptional regulator n=1 Tax=Prosthecochloris aestuarii TaxID=1102 RepID=A0A831WVB4_PROAE|nr:sigma-54-dependent Fis family transcriptional regulator [Prosthecochloris sp.]HED31029.1 sigma-54-dependent Fis family transcriptional regulator [Prosthecochloris aestuarii]
MNTAPDILGTSPGIIQLKHLARQVAETEVTILVTGETGTGKEVLARFIHAHSHRSANAFIPVNCGAIPSGILESELFGHEKGSFTGAVQSRKGYFESAHRGTIFLDEIGEMPLETQVKLLRILETGEFQRVGSSQTMTTDTRIIAATNRNLQREVAEKNFREDLYYRLHSVELTIPPLRERGRDILLLAEHFIRQFERKHAITFEGFSQSSAEMLLRYNWPGNVRELRNLVESLLILEKGKEITPDILERHLVQRSRFKSLVHDREKSERHEISMIYSSLIQLHQEISDIRQLLLQQTSRTQQPEPQKEQKTPLLLPAPSAQKPDTTDDTRYVQPLEEVEKKAIASALSTFGNNKRRTARALGITERTLYRKIKSYGLD